MSGGGVLFEKITVFRHHCFSSRGYLDMIAAVLIVSVLRTQAITSSAEF